VPTVEGAHAATVPNVPRTAAELTRLDHRLAACDAPAAANFREAFAAL
jgi:hypothetical protein